MYYLLLAHLVLSSHMASSFLNRPGILSSSLACRWRAKVRPQKFTIYFQFSIALLHPTVNITIWLYLVSFPGYSQTVSHSHGGKTSSWKQEQYRRRESWYVHRGSDVNVYLGRQRGGGVQMTLRCFTRCVSPRAEVLTWMLAKWTKLFRMKNVGPLPLFLSWGLLPPLSTYIAIITSCLCIQLWL